MGIQELTSDSGIPQLNTTGGIYNGQTGQSTWTFENPTTGKWYAIVGCFCGPDHLRRVTAEQNVTCKVRIDNGSLAHTNDSNGVSQDRGCWIRDQREYTLTWTKGGSSLAYATVDNTNVASFFQIHPIENENPETRWVGYRSFALQFYEIQGARFWDGYTGAVSETKTVTVQVHNDGTLSSGENCWSDGFEMKVE